MDIAHEHLMEINQWVIICHHPIMGTYRGMSKPTIEASIGHAMDKAEFIQVMRISSYQSPSYVR
jgi:hypothetical protein